MRPESRIRRMRPEHVDGTRTVRAKQRTVTRRAQRIMKYT